MKMDLFFNRIYVIESLLDDERKTGKHLYENKLMHLNAKYPNLSCELHQVGTKQEFLDLLSEIETGCKADAVFPIIHLECHGSETGLQMSNKEFIDWEDLREDFVSINIACRLNLLVTVAACSGAYLIFTARRMDTVPFFAVIGVEKEISNLDLEAGFNAFYGEFFKSLDGDKAIAALNGEALKKGHRFQMYTARSLFIRGFKDYYQKYGQGKGKRKRVEDLTTAAMKNPGVASKGVKWVRDYFKDTLSRPEEDMANLKEKFFFIDVAPENDDRFPISFNEDILANKT